MRVAVGVLIGLFLAACGSPGQVSCDALRRAPHAQEMDAYHAMPPGVAAPRNAEEAMAALDRTLTSAQKAQVRCAANPVELHFSLGRWIRNEWGLYDRSPLARDMIAKGFIDPEGMSAAIIAGYAQHLSGQRADFAALAARDRAGWTERGVDVDAELENLAQ